MSAPAQRVIGVDVGGTKVLSGRVGRDGSVEARRETPTVLDDEEALLVGIERAVADQLDETVVAIGFGLPSRIDHRAGRAMGSVNVPLDDVDFRDRMQARFDRPVGLENDAGAAAYAEWAFGAGRGTRNMVMLTLGTGVGGGIVIEGRLYRGWAELGHIVVEHDGAPCQGTCTGRGHLEAVASGTAADAAAKAEFGEAVDAHRLVRIANEGDERARELLAVIGRKLGSGIGSLVNIFNPEVVVIGGGFAAADELLLGPAREIVAREALWPAGETVRIVRAELGTAAGLVGAGLVAFDALEAAP